MKKSLFADIRSYSAFLEKDYGIKLAENSPFHIIQAPYEDNVSYGLGTKKGPKAIIAASQFLEISGDDNEPAQAGIYTFPPLKCKGKAIQVINEISSAVLRSLEMGAFPVLLGGEHTVSCGMAKALFQKYGEKLAVVHFDSHCDLRPIYYDNKFSHACVMRRIVEDYCCKIFQIGTRSYCQEEAKYRWEQGIHSLDAEHIVLEGIPKKILPENFPENIYISFDVDVFDPSVVPSTGTPEPGGLNWYQVISLLKLLFNERRVVAFDIVELSPIRGLHHADYTVAKLTYMMMKLVMTSTVSNLKFKKEPKG